MNSVSCRPRIYCLALLEGLNFTTTATFSQLVVYFLINFCPWGHSVYPETQVLAFPRSYSISGIITKSMDILLLRPMGLSLEFNFRVCLVSILALGTLFLDYK